MPYKALLTLLLLTLPSLASAQEETCDAKPRWLLVTVVQDRDNIGGETKTATWPEGELRLVDRCQADHFSVTSASKQDPGLTLISKFYTDSKGKISTFVDLWVKESLHDICLAMRDCADATALRH